MSNIYNLEPIEKVLKEWKEPEEIKALLLEISKEYIQNMPESTLVEDIKENVFYLDLLAETFGEIKAI